MKPNCDLVNKAMFLFIACSVLSSLGHCSTLLLKGRAPRLCLESSDRQRNRLASEEFSF